MEAVVMADPDATGILERRRQRLRANAVARKAAGGAANPA
jgi:hypothetical protein